MTPHPTKRPNDHAHEPRRAVRGGGAAIVHIKDDDPRIPMLGNYPIVEKVPVMGYEDHLLSPAQRGMVRVFASYHSAISSGPYLVAHEAEYFGNGRTNRLVEIEDRLLLEVLDEGGDLLL